MNHRKVILVGAISGLVTVLTWILGVSGTIVGSILFSVLYTMLSEWLEDPVSNAKFNPEFEWDIVYVIPLVVIAFIQLLLILALLAERGILPYTFVNFFLSLQQLTDNNLYRLLGLALLFISAYPLVLRPGVVKKSHGLILAFVGLIFLARGFVDLGIFITDMYGLLFAQFDLPIAIIAFILITYVIFHILSLSNKPNRGLKQNSGKDEDYIHVNHERNAPKHFSKGEYSHRNNHHNSHDVKFRGNVRHNPNMNQNKPHKGFNASSSDFHFESNDLLDDFKK